MKKIQNNSKRCCWIKQTRYFRSIRNSLSIKRTSTNRNCFIQYVRKNSDIYRKKFKDTSLNRIINILENIYENSTLNKHQSRNISEKNYFNERFSNNEILILDVSQNLLIENDMEENIQDSSSNENITGLLNVTDNEFD